MRRLDCPAQQTGKSAVISRKKVLVMGDVAGLTAALAARYQLHSDWGTVMASDIETMKGPITPTPEVATCILCRALRLVDFVQQNARISEYAHWEYEEYAKSATERGMPVPSEEEVANVSVRELAFLKKAIENILCDGTRTSKQPEIGMYL